MAKKEKEQKGITLHWWYGSIIVIVLILAFILFINNDNNLKTYTKTLYIKSDLYPLHSIGSVFNPSFIIYPQNQSNGTACGISITENTPIFNFTSQSYSYNLKTILQNQTIQTYNFI
jgi:hypothetical protein